MVHCCMYNVHVYIIMYNVIVNYMYILEVN